MEKLTKSARIFLGVFFTVFGLNGLVMITFGKGFIPMPPPAESFAPIMGALFSAKFVMPVAKLIQVVSGLLFLSNRYTNLALILLAPVMFSIVASHLVVGDFAGLPFGILALVAFVIVAKERKEFIKVALS